MSKKIILILIIVLIFINPVFAKKIYQIDDNTGDPFTLQVDGNLLWDVSFITYGSENTIDGRLPYLSIPEAGINIDTSTGWGHPYSWHAFWAYFGDPYWGVRHGSNPHYTTALLISEGTYNFDLASWGDGIDEGTVDELAIAWGDSPEDHSCQSFEDDGYFSYCQSAARCQALVNPNACAYRNGECDVDCNGLSLEIYFFDSAVGTDPGDEIGQITPSDFEDWTLYGTDTKDTYYVGIYDRWFVTDNNPGEVHIQQTLNINLICEDECASGEVGCENLFQRYTCELGADGCYDKQISDCTPGELCQDGICSSDVIVYWADMTGTQIGETVGIEAQVNDTVKMIFKNTALADTDVVFEIFEDDAVSDDEIKTINSRTDSTGLAVEKWTITDKDYLQGTNIGELDDGHMEFYFTIASETSDNLFVTPTEDDEPTSVMIAKPELDSRHKTLQIIDFEQICSDKDDDLDIVWDFGDETKERFFNILTTKEGNTTHSYVDTGTKNIVLTAESTRGKSVSDYSRVFIYDEGIIPFANISEPWPPGQIFAPTQVKIGFDASLSWIANCSEDETKLPVPYEYTVDDLYCYDLDKADIGTTYEFWFDWVFSDGTARAGTWSTEYDDVVDFEKAFLVAGTHEADLKVGYENL